MVCSSRGWILWLALAPLPAQKLVSGPPRGTALPALRVVAVMGADAGREADAAEGLRQGPAAILFVHVLDRNTAPMVRAFDEEAAALAVLGLDAVTVFLAQDRTEAEQRVPVVSRALNLVRPMVVAVDGAEGPGGYALARKAALTLVLARDGVVTDSVALLDTGRQDLEFLQLCLGSVAGAPPADAEIEHAVATAVPADVGQLRAIVVQLERQRRALVQQLAQARQAQAQARRGDAARPAMPDAAPPMVVATPAPAAAGVATVLAGVQDEELGQIVRRLLRRDASASDADEAMAALERRLVAAPDARSQVRTAFAAILERADLGGEAARVHMRRWLEGR